MKRLFIMESAAIIATLLILAVMLNDENKMLTGFCAVVLLLDICGILYQTIYEKKMMDFLISDNKKKQNTEVQWNKDEEEKLALLRKRIDLSTLQMQINPHFLYNTLDTIRSEALMNEHENIASMTEKLARFFRYCISNKENMVKIQEELNHIYDYYYIQKQRFGDRFEMSVHVENEEIYDYYMPKLTLQPLVENAIAHGLEKVRRKGEIVIHIFSTEKKVVLCIADNGIGMSETDLKKMNDRLRLHQVKVSSKSEKGNGIAIYNVNSRIQLTFGTEYGIHYRSVENMGTKALVTLPKVDDFTRVHYEKALMQEVQ